MKQCPNCKVRLEDWINYCTVCGLELSPYPTLNSPNIQRSNSNSEQFLHIPPPPPNHESILVSNTIQQNQYSNVPQIAKKSDTNTKNIKTAIFALSLILNLVLVGLLFVFAGEDILFERDNDSKSSLYPKEDEVLNRDRIIYRKYSITMDWEAYSRLTHKNWEYTIEMKLSEYIESLRRDHSINYLNKDSVKKYVDSWEKDFFYFQNLHNSFPNDVDLANALLDLVHALEYKNDPVEIEDVRYPEESLIEGCGDCEDLVMLYCALLEANGLDAVFIVWEEHAQACVYLEEPPSTSSGTLGSINHEGKKYYICECTGGYEWDVGDMPFEHQSQSLIIIHDV